MTETAARKHYLDNIRWLTVLAVVLYHVLYMYNGEGIRGGLGKITALDTQYYDLYLYFVYPWIMPLLFLVSGAAARCALERQAAGAFLRRRTVRLLVPSTLGLFVFQFLQGYVNLALGGAWETIPAALRYPVMALSGVGVLWYIQLLWVFTAALVLLRRWERDRLWRLGAKTNVPVLLALTVPLWGAAQVFNTPVVVVYRFGLYGAVFLLGYFVFSHDEVTERLKRAFYPLLAVALGLGVAFCRVYFGQNYADAPVNRSPLFAAYGWIACLAVFGGVARYGDAANGFTRRMGRHSFGLYVFHYLGVSSTALFLGRTGALPAWAVYAVSLLVGFVCGYGLDALLSRLPFFRWAVLGIQTKANRKEEALC